MILQDAESARKIASIS